MSYKNRAFTLIELLVVIAIIGILTGFVFVSMNGAIVSTKDAKRKADLSSIQKAIFGYQAAGNTLTIATNCIIGQSGCIGYNNQLNQYLNTIPTDPDSTKNYTYTSTDGNNFTIAATLSTGAIYSYDTTTGWITGIAGYGHYKIITLNNTSGSSLTNYPIKISLGYATGANSGANCEGVCNNSFNDIVFTDSTGTQALSFWLETGSLVSGTSVTAWVNVPSIATGNNTQIRMYYQSASPTYISNGYNTFSSSQNMFFDDFEPGGVSATSIATFYNGFSAGYGTYSVSSGIFSTYSGSSSWYGLQTKNSLVTNGYAVEAYMKVSSDTDAFLLGGYRTNVSNTSATKYWSLNGTNNSRSYAFDANYHRFSLKLGTSNTIYAVDGTTQATLGANTYTESFFCATAQSNHTIYLDWWAVRKYTSSEPTYSFGSQN
jgi:prepilin-type N-terminal cleavage/methylation domain-containing protein